MKKFPSQIIFTVYFILFISGSEAFAQEEAITLQSSSGEIFGTLTLPSAKQNIPVVLIIAGSGPTDRNGNQGDKENNSYKFLADSLRVHGIASVRYDKRGIAKSADAMTEESDLRFDNYVDDVSDWVELLAKDKRFSKIIIAGHSEGSLLGMIAANKNKHTTAYISIAGAGRPIDEVLKEQLAKTPDNIRKKLYSYIDILKKGDTIGNVAPIFASLFRQSLQPYMISWFKYNPQEEMKKLTLPALILQGNTDIQVSEEDAQLLKKAKPDAELHIITNMNHVLKDCDTKDKDKQTPIYENPDLPLNKELVKFTVAFINGLK